MFTSHTTEGISEVPEIIGVVMAIAHCEDVCEVAHPARLRGT